MQSTDLWFCFAARSELSCTRPFLLPFISTSDHIKSGWLVLSAPLRTLMTSMWSTSEAWCVTPATRIREKKVFFFFNYSNLLITRVIISGPVFTAPEPRCRSFLLVRVFSPAQMSHVDVEKVAHVSRPLHYSSVVLDHIFNTSKALSLSRPGFQWWWRVAVFLWFQRPRLVLRCSTSAPELSWPFKAFLSYYGIMTNFAMISEWDVQPDLTGSSQKSVLWDFRSLFPVLLFVRAVSESCEG